MAKLIKLLVAAALVTISMGASATYMQGNGSSPVEHGWNTSHQRGEWQRGEHQRGKHQQGQHQQGEHQQGEHHQGDCNNDDNCYNVPEPGMLGLLAIGLLGMVMRRRTRL